VRLLVPPWLALGGPAGSVLFNVAWLVLGFVSPGFTIWGTTVAPYLPISAGISGLGLGPTALYMNGAFVLSGLLLLGGVIGICWNIGELTTREPWVSMCLLGLCAIGMVMDGIFTLESMLLHLVGFVLGVGSLVPGFLFTDVVVRRIRRWPGVGGCLIVSGLLTLGLLLL